MIKTSKNIKEILAAGLVWVNVSEQGTKELGEIGKRFSYDEQDIKESLPPFQRPKIVKRAEYLFMVLHFPVFDRETKRLGFTEIDFFLNASQLVTVHNGKLAPIDQFFDECKKNAGSRDKYFSGTAVHITFELLSRLLDAIFPILLHVNDDINLVDRKLFSKNVGGREMAEEILRLKTNIVTFRRTMQGHRTVLERLIMYSGRDLDLVSYQSYINSIREFTNEIWNMLESQKESINALHETNESLLGLRMNEVMKTLTVISVITFPLTLMVALFDFHAPSNPFIHMPGGFWLVASLVLWGAILMYAMFKKRKWL
ncbi:MAG: magnesium transporter CorA family protein [bacterium]|nr:magnesium transporter CorA family protein [bacterium]